MNGTQKSKAQLFRELHRREGCFLMPNAWDIGSAKLLASAGFETIGTTSAGIAFSLGRPDNVFCSQEARLDRDTMLEHVRRIAGAVSLPLSADLEDGYGESPEAVAETVRRAIAAGAVGGNIEDYTGDRDRPLYDRQLAVERIQAAREAVDASGIPFVLVGRTDALNGTLADGFAQAVERSNAYYEAGADCLFAPGAADATSIRRLVGEVEGPMNVVMGLAGNDLSMSELRALGVRRISIGGSLARAMYYRMREAAQEMLEHGTFGFAEHQIAQSELNQIFEESQPG